MTVDRDGPILIEGPVEVVGEDGTTTRSDRFVVAVCTCRRSRAYPWCDTSHRGHRKSSATGHHADVDQRSATDSEDPHDGNHN
ncbi:CDGSH iron-sulfur domain-containing protein [Streptomyces sp. LN785]|uniref:CDGSH iron-sulfur domain-containing protein n=1 Tax=Streptomyces sp. LN785 TaxID=3112983 RepID=UPI0037154DFB